MPVDVDVGSLQTLFYLCVPRLTRSVELGALELFDCVGALSSYYFGRANLDSRAHLVITVEVFESSKSRS